ncbi:MAG: ATPase [Bacteroidales bacterium]|nr:ATPase [Bacteroidales bacterium]
MKQIIAIPTSKDCLCGHFGHCEKFAILAVKNNNITEEIYITPPPHEPGFLPEWLASKGVTHIIAGGMGYRAISLFSQQNIQVITGAQEKPARILVEEFINNQLITGINTCDH